MEKLLSAPAPPHGRRPYRSPSRDAAAALTRHRIIDAAEALFLSSGYVATSVRSIARAADVAEKTVYLQFDTKPAILKAVISAAIGGSDDAARMARSQWFLDVLAQPRLDRKIELLAEATSALHERTGLVFTVAREAATVDTEVEALYKRGKQGQLTDMTTLAKNLAEHGLIPSPLGVDWAIDVLYILLGPENWYLLRHELGHDQHHYQNWLHTTLAQALEPKRTRAHTPPG